MKKLALLVAISSLSVGAALAADLPTRKGPPVLPPPPPPPPMWTGFYLGLNAGGTWANSNLQTIGVGPVAVDPFWANNGPLYLAGYQSNYLGAFAAAASAGGVNAGNNGGFIGGGQIGYNWQFYNSFVAGIEADIQGIASSSTSRTVVSSAPVFPGLVPETGLCNVATCGDAFTGVTSARGRLEYLGTVRGRLGWLFTPTLLVYGTGGLAYGGVSLNSSTVVSANPYYWSPGGGVALPSYATAWMPSSVGGVNFANTQVGWTAGGGLEWMFWPNWSAKVEYLYYDLGSVTQNFVMASQDTFVAFDGTPYPGAAIFGGQVRARVNGNIVRAGLNYHFNWGAPAPVVAKY
jgi:outer membrane immunogenic protein